VSVANVSISLQGALTTRPASCNGASSGSTSGPVFTLGLPSALRSATSQVGGTIQTIDSAASFEALPIPANQRTTLAYLRGLDIAPLIMRLTFETSDPVEIPLGSNAPFLSGFAADDRVTEIAIKGQGRIEWLAAGGIV
jgi:hypothetical protein